MIQEHLSLKGFSQKYIRKSGTWKFESVSGQKGFYYKATTMGFRYWKRSTISGVSGIK
jgi:hypothetical protein